MFNALKCNTCKRYLNQTEVPDTKDCGGDCLRCMAMCYDADAMAEMHKLEPENSMWVDTPEPEAQAADAKARTPFNEAPAHIRISLVLQHVAATLNEYLDNAAGEPVVFVLMVNADKTTQYVSNASRDDGIELIESLLTRLHANAPVIPAHKNPDLNNHDHSEG